MLDNSNGNWIVLKHQYITCKAYFQANMQRTLNGLTHWGRVMHICICKLTIIGSDNGLVTSHYLNQWWNIVNRTLGNKLQWNLNRNLYILIQGNALQNVVWKWRPFCLSFNELTWLPDCDMFIFMIVTLEDKITHLLFFVIILFQFCVTCGPCGIWCHRLLVFCLYVGLPANFHDFNFNISFRYWFLKHIHRQRQHICAARMITLPSMFHYRGIT